jgi:hypothetical protein
MVFNLVLMYSCRCNFQTCRCFCKTLANNSYLFPFPLPTEFLSLARLSDSYVCKALRSPRQSKFVGFDDIAESRICPEGCRGKHQNLSVFLIEMRN